MAEVWESTAVETGRWFANNGTWQSHYTNINGTSAGGGQRYATRFQVEVPQGSVILNAQLTYPVITGLTNIDVETNAFDLDDVPAMQGMPTSGPFTTAVPADTGSPRIADVTDIVQQIVNRPGWTEGNSIAFLLRHLTAHEVTYSRDVTLDVQWQPNVQYLEPVTVQVPVTVGRITPSYEITVPDTLDVPVSVGAVDIVAPRTLNARAIYVPLRVNQAQMSGTGDAPPLDVAGRIDVGVTVGVALLSLTIAPPPPPIPWQRFITDPQYRAALNSREPVTDARVEIIDPDGAIIATLGGEDATLPGVVAGTVTCSGTDAIRWTCDLTIDNPDLVPESHHDLLHPLAHNAVRIWWRIQLPDGTWGEIPVGTYHLDWPTVTDTGDGTIGLAAQGSDAVAEVKRARYRDPIDVGGMTADMAVRTILQDRAPWATLSITPSDYRLPQDYEAGEPGGDPIEDITKIAESAGMIFYADRMGTLTLTDQPDPGTPVEEFIEGPGCAMTEISASVNLDDLLNSVTVASTVTQDEDGNDIEPITAHVEDDDPTSPLWIGRGRIRHRRIEHDYVETQQQAENVARRTLDQHRAAVDQVELVAFARPHLDPWDVITVSADRARVTGARQVQSWSLALGDLSGQRITTVGRRGLT